MNKGKVIELDHSGNGIVKENNKVIFVPKVVPGDLISYKVVSDKKRYSNGRVVDIIEKSSDRMDSICSYYKECGGCNISNYSYEKQLEYKKNKVKNIFKKYLDMDYEFDIIPSKLEYGYRNKITYHYDKNLGLISIDNKIINIDECLLVSDNINNIFNKIKKDDISKIKEIVIREVTNGLILKINGEFDYNKYKDDFIEIYMNNKLVYSKEEPYIVINDLKYKITGNSFFQVNTTNISNLYDMVIKYGNFKKCDVVCDLYCGVGSISLYIAKYVKGVFGIEIVEDAIKNAIDNANINNITNARFLCGDVSKQIDNIKECNVIIVDPPRCGLDKHTIDVLNNIKLDRLIYVSCEPMTLSRDIKLLNNYTFIDATLVDMFPQTAHCEVITCLKLKE